MSAPPRGGAIAGNVCQIPTYPPPLPQVGEVGQTIIDRCIMLMAINKYYSYILHCQVCLLMHADYTWY